MWSLGNFIDRLWENYKYEQSENLVTHEGHWSIEVQNMFKSEAFPVIL